MSFGSRYRRLLESVYLDIHDAVHDRLMGGGRKVLRPNLLEFVPYDESFYNVGVGLPSHLPLHPSEAPEPEIRGFKTLAPLVAKCLQRLQPDVQRVFEHLHRLMLNREWLPAIFSADLEEMAEAWEEWYRNQVLLARSKGGQSRLRDAETSNWKTFCSLLLAITPQPANGMDNSGATRIYRSLGFSEGRSDPDLDGDDFLKPQRGNKGYPWRFSDSHTSYGRLRDLLELIYLIPLTVSDRRKVLRNALSLGPEPIVRVREAMRMLELHRKLKALGGPLIHHGQLEGILYVAAPADVSLGGIQNRHLKEIARDGAARRHRLREQVVRDVLLREAQDPAAFGRAPLLVLRHLPKLLSVQAGVAIQVTEPLDEHSSAGLVTRIGASSQRSSMWSLAELERSTDPGGRRFHREIRNLVARWLGSAGSEDRVRCYAANAPEVGKLRAAIRGWTRTTQIRSVGSICLLEIGSQSSENAESGARWVSVLFFREPPRRAADKPWEQNIADSLRQMQLEIESLVDFVESAARSSSLRIVLGQTGHALVTPTSRAVQRLGHAQLALKRGDREAATAELAHLHESLMQLHTEALAAKLFFGSAEIQTRTVDLGSLVRSKIEVSRDGGTGVELEAEGLEEREWLVRGDEGLCAIIVSQLLDNAVDAARILPHEMAQDRGVWVKLRIEDLHLVLDVQNRSVRETPSDLSKVESNARNGIPNRSRTSGGTGLGVLYCHKMAQEMGGDLELKGEVVDGVTHVKASLRLPVATLGP